MPEHNTLTGASLHEPKGVAGAAANKVYHSDGSLSGSWEFPILEGIGALGATDLGKRWVSDGAGGGHWKHGHNIHGEMFVSGHTTPFAITAAVDSTLATDSDYSLITGASMWQAGHLDGVTFNVDEIKVTVAGEYKIDFWASIEVSTTSTLLGVKYAINKSTPYSPRKILSKSKNTTDINNIFGSGVVTSLSVNDTLSLYVAADTSCNIIGREAGFILTLLDEA